MNFQLNGLVTAMVVAVGMATFVGTASAQGIPGTFFPIDGSDAFEAGNTNTVAQVDRGTAGSTFIGTRFSSTNPGGNEFPNGFLDFWEERAWILTENGTELTALGYTGIAFPPTDPQQPDEFQTDPAIVTTLTGLDAGAYEVHFSFAGALRTPDDPRLQYQTGFSATSTSQIAAATSANRLNDVDLVEPINGTLQVFSSLIGDTSVGPDGELRVYTDLDPFAGPGPASGPNDNNTAFLGLSLVQATATTVCDFDADDDCDTADIDMLYEQFGTTNAAFDLDGSGNVDANDIETWLLGASEPTNPANPDGVTFVRGDVDFNGDVDSTDLGLLLNNFGSTDGLLYTDGNLDDDANVGSSDLGLLLNNFGFTSAASAVAVPEPSAAGLWLTSFALLIIRWRRRQNAA